MKLSFRAKLTIVSCSDKEACQLHYMYFQTAEKHGTDLYLQKSDDKTTLR